MSLIDKVLYNQSQCWQTLHDMEDPSKIIVAVDVWIPPPNEVDENAGYFHNMVFTCGAVPEENGIVKYIGWC